MAARYVCPVDGKQYPDVEEFINHAVAAHGHQVNRNDCRCDCCTAGEEK